MPAMISYSINREDVVLAKVFSDVSLGFYVEVGANDPVEGSNTYHFYQKGWHGICLEPGTICHKFAKARPRDISLNIAASDQAGELVFHEFPVGHALSSLHDRQPDVGAQFLTGKTTRKVRVEPLREIFAKHKPPGIDFMGIDVEGHERQVLLGNDWTQWRPKVLFLEATAEGRNTPGHHLWEDLVTSAGYKFAYFDGLNRFYVREESVELVERFQPPCVFDNYKTLEELRKEEEIRCLRADLQTFQESFQIGRRSLKAGLAFAKVLHMAFGGKAPGSNGRKAA